MSPSLLLRIATALKDQAWKENDLCRTKLGHNPEAAHDHALTATILIDVAGAIVKVLEDEHLPKNP